MSTVGDTHLGAEDFDNKLLEVCIEQFKKNTNIELINEWMAIQKLKKKCSRVRKVLSSEQEAFILVEDLVPGQKFEMKVTRAEWEKICDSILKKTMTLTNKALEDARISAKDISMVILAGGATRVPIITELLHGMFPGK